MHVFVLFFYSEDEVSKKKPIEWQIEKKKKYREIEDFYVIKMMIFETEI